jgi:hypothetical protein
VPGGNQAIDIPSRRRQDLEPQGEFLVCELLPRKSKKLAIILCYRPPSSNSLAFTESVEQTLTNVFKEYEHVCMLGDFNLPRVNWTADPIIAKGSLRTLCDTIAGFSMSQINHIVSNSFGSMLDLVFTNVPNLFCDVAEYPSVFHSDHAVLSLN